MVLGVGLREEARRGVCFAAVDKGRWRRKRWVLSSKSAPGGKYPSLGCNMIKKGGNKLHKLLFSWVALLVSDDEEEEEEEEDDDK